MTDEVPKGSNRRLVHNFGSVRSDPEFEARLAHSLVVINLAQSFAHLLACFPPLVETFCMTVILKTWCLCIILKPHAVELTVDFRRLLSYLLEASPRPYKYYCLNPA